MTSAPGLAQVIDGGFCVDCGACAGLDPRFDVRFDEISSPPLWRA